MPIDLKRLKNTIKSTPDHPPTPAENFGCFRGRQMPGEVVLVELVQNRQKHGFCRPQYRLTETESDFFFYFKVFPKI